MATSYRCVHENENTGAITATRHDYPPCVKGKDDEPDDENKKCPGFVNSWGKLVSCDISDQWEAGDEKEIKVDPQSTEQQIKK